MLPFFGLSLPKGRVLVTNLGVGASYSATQSAAAVSVIFRFKTDGTWVVEFGPGDTSGGSPLSGTWLVSGGVASQHEIKYTPSNAVGSPTVNNGAAAYTAMSAQRSIEFTKTNADASADLLIEIREIADTAFSVSDSTSIEVNGAP